MVFMVVAPRLCEDEIAADDIRVEYPLSWNFWLVYKRRRQYAFPLHHLQILFCQNLILSYDAI